MKPCNMDDSHWRSSSTPFCHVFGGPRLHVSAAATAATAASVDVTGHPNFSSPIQSVFAKKWHERKAQKQQLGFSTPPLLRPPSLPFPPTSIGTERPDADSRATKCGRHTHTHTLSPSDRDHNSRLLRIGSRGSRKSARSATKGSLVQVTLDRYVVRNVPELSADQNVGVRAAVPPHHASGADEEETALSQLSS